ncbi:hypothetical protein D3C72_2086490 [compost metagenome]
MRILNEHGSKAKLSGNVSLSFYRCLNDYAPHDACSISYMVHGVIGHCAHSAADRVEFDIQARHAGNERFVLWLLLSHATLPSIVVP